MRNKSYKSNWKNFFIKIILPTLLTILLFISTIFFIIIPRFEENLMIGKREMIKELTNSACSILAKYENDEKKGLLTKEEAQKTAISRIQYLRYGEESKDYFWITDMYPNMIMHPYREDLNGKDLLNYTDQHGKKLFVEFVKVVKEKEHGYVDYMWQWKDDSSHIVPKLSYVKLFKPWNWVIGTGIYIEDVEKEISSLTSKLIMFSLGITGLIALLLLSITQQSIKIEQKRINAENKLKESIEKYKTLVEASTEGLIMVIDNKIIYSNDIFHKITGFDGNELMDMNIVNILSSENDIETQKLFSKETIKEGQYEVSFKKKNNKESIETLLTVSPISFSGRSGNIIIIKDITIDKGENFKNIDYTKLISKINIGFFRATLDIKGRIIDANQAAINMLGFDNINELRQSYIFDLFKDSDEKKFFRKNLIQDGFIKNKVIRINRKDGSMIIVSASIVVIRDINNIPILCDGSIEDITIATKEKDEAENIITDLVLQQSYINQTISDYIKQPVTVNMNDPLSKIVSLMSGRKLKEIIVSTDNNEYIGIITYSDLISRVLSINLNIENPAYIIMSSPLISITENNSLKEAISIAEENKVNHLVVKNNNGKHIGVISLEDIHQSLINNNDQIIHQIQIAESDEQLQNYQKKISKIIKPYIENNINISYINKIISDVSDEITKRLIEICINELGEPPVKFSFIALGSKGRNEQTFYTDQDNAIIYEDVPKDKETEVQNYFNKLADKACNSLDFIGYSFCEGNIMAKNPQWCKPISVWKKYFSTWINTPEPQNLLDAIIFFDYNTTYGELSFENEISNLITELVKERTVFFFHLATNAINFKFTQSKGFLTDKNTDTINLKNLITPIIMFARIYSLQNNINETNTLNRLKAIFDKDIISETTYNETVYAYNFLMHIRFKNQLTQIENKLTPDNIISSKNYNEYENIILKKIITNISTLQTKLATDYKVNV